MRRTFIVLSFRGLVGGLASDLVARRGGLVSSYFMLCIKLFIFAENFDPELRLVCNGSELYLYKLDWLKV